MADGIWMWVLTEIDTLTLGFGDPFIAVANVEMFWISVVMLMGYSFAWAIRGGNSIITGFMHFLFLLLVTQTIIHYYNTPLPGMRSSFKLLIPNIATELANTISMSRYDMALQRIIYVADNLEKPAFSLTTGIDISAIILYAFVTFDMWLLGGFLMIPMLLGFVAFGIISVIWPVFIPWLMVPRMSYLFWNSLNAAIKYNFFRVAAQALTFVWAGIIMSCIDHLVFPDMPGHTYSIGQFTTKVVISLLGLNMACIVCIFALPGIVTDMISGGASAGGKFLTAVASFVRKG
jgi:hypothetical protein